MSNINAAYPIYGTPTTQSVRDNFAAAKAEIETLQAASVTMPSGDIWLPINAHYDGANWQRNDTSKYAFALVFQAFSSIPGEEAFGGNTGFMFLRCTPGANPISSTWWTTGGWENALIIDQFRHLVVGGQGIEIDGAGGVPFGRVTHTAVSGSGNTRTGLLSNLYIDFSDVDATGSPSWFVGRKNDTFTVERAAAGGTTEASLTELLRISSGGAIAIGSGTIPANGKAGTLFAGLNIAQPQNSFVSWNVYQDTSNVWRSIAGGGVAYMTSNGGIITFNAAASSTAGNTVVPTQILQLSTLGITMAGSTDISLSRDPINTLHATTKQYVDNKAVGVTDASNAAAGRIGEVITATGTSVAHTNGVAANCCSVSLTAGDWDIAGQILFAPSGGTYTQIAAGGNTTSATLTTAPNGGHYVQTPAGGTTLGNTTAPVTRHRVNVNATTTYYLVGQASFGAGTSAMTGIITARRMR